MFKILETRPLNNSVVYMKIEAPYVAKKIKPGQFIILMIDEKSERVPFTVEDYSEAEGWVSICFQIVGKTSLRLSEMKAGEYLRDFVGPLGVPTKIDGYKKVAVVGGGLGCAIAYPIAKALHNSGAEVDMIAGFRNTDMFILIDEMKAASNRLFVLTDDGSNGKKGLVTDALKENIEEGANYDLVIAIGPPIMMKFVSLLTKDYGIKTIVSLNPIMIDGTGMCGCCRVRVNGETKFACVDGPDFDGHKVDFDELMSRNRAYADFEKEVYEGHKCRIGRTDR